MQQAGRQAGSQQAASSIHNEHETIEFDALNRISIFFFLLIHLIECGAKQKWK